MRSIMIQGALLCALTTSAHAGESHQFVGDPKVMGRDVTASRPIPPGLQRVMAEGAGRVANMTCADVRSVVSIYGAWKAEAVARAAGATEHQIREAKRCLGSSSR